MSYLVDANVLSEPTKSRADSRVKEWLRRNEGSVAVDPIILGEIRYGILVLDSGAKRSRLETWFDDVVATIHCLPWDTETALRWAKLLADLKNRRTSMPVKDSLIAATALVHGLSIVTRNVVDFEKSGVPVVNPFDDAPGL